MNPFSFQLTAISSHPLKVTPLLRVIKTRPDHQRGTLMFESILILMPILFVFGFILEMTQMNHARNIARLALYQAGRYASVTHARPEGTKGFEKVFKRSMLALFVPKGPHISAESRQDAHIQRLRQRTGMSPWKLDVLTPTKASFSDFADAKLSRANRKSTIRHDYQDVQHQQKLRQGWSGGRGPQSMQTIFQANTLRIKLTYLHQPVLPGLQTVLKILGDLRTDEVGQAWRQGLFAIVLDHEVMMQSDLQDWW